MKLLDYYLQIRLMQPEQEELQTSLKTLSEQLCCTERNAKLLLKRMEEEQWLTWTRGRGRGKLSHLQFLQPLDAAAHSAWDILIAQGKLEEAAALLREPFPALIKEQLTQKLQALFGYQSDEAAQDILRIPVRRKLTLLDPARVSITAESHLVQQIFDTLVYFNEDTREIEPLLAHYWRQEEQGTVWTFFLRKGVRFHHGRTLTAEDVLYTFRRLMDVGQPSSNQWMMDEITDISSPAPLQVRFCLRRPNRFFLHVLATANCAILPHDLPFTETQLVGTGPFMMHHYSSSMLILQAFPDYFRERAHLDRIELLLVPADTVHILDYELTEETTEAQTYWMEELGARFISFNLTKPGPLQDAVLRQAIAELADGRLLVEQLGGRRSGPASSFFPSVSRSQPVRKSFAAALKHLQNSRYDGEPLRIFHLDFADSTEDARWLQARCAAAGIRTELQPFRLTDYYDEEQFAGADLLLMGEVFTRDTELSFIQVFQNQSCFVSRFMSPQHRCQLNQLLAPLFLTDSRPVREQLMREIEHFLEQEYIIIFNYHVRKNRVFPEALNGVRMNAFGWADFRRLWIEG